MVSSAQAIKDKLKSICREKNVDFNSIMRFYMYDRFIERLSKSEYSDNFILKGGFYLSTLFGIDNRSTIDIDTAIRNTEFTEDNIVKMVEEIISVDIKDNAKFAIEKVEDIRQEDEYGGVRITIGFRLENINDRFHIDIATGDPIHPRPDNYRYSSLFGDEVYKVWSYNLETILAEKLETILNKLETSSRMKDYYDIYLIYKFKFEKIDNDILRKAVTKTFKKREFHGDLISCLRTIKNSDILKMRWASYARKNNYAKDLAFEEILECLEKFIDMLVPVAV